MEIIETTEQRTSMRCVRAASVRYEDTGEVRIVVVRAPDGSEREEERPIKRQIEVPAEYVEETTDITIYSVFDGAETHKFQTPAAAESFIKGY